MRTDIKRTDAGFSLIELMIAMAITLMIMAITSAMLAQAFSVRRREDRRTEALADVQRALNLMSREIANSGYRLPSGLTYLPPTGPATLVPTNGLLTAYCDGDSIAFVSNLNAFDPNANATSRGSVNETDESTIFTLQNQTLVRMDLASRNALVLADRIQSFEVTYLNRNGANAPTAGTVGANTIGVRLAVVVPLPAIGTRGTAGYQPASEVRVMSEVALRNGALDLY
jgi:prepilin-type N-terminal cleavage/methylation domain-containing protein